MFFRIFESHAYWKIWVIIQKYNAHDGQHGSYITLISPCFLTGFFEGYSLLIDCHSVPFCLNPVKHSTELELTINETSSPTEPLPLKSLEKPFSTMQQAIELVIKLWR